LTELGKRVGKAKDTVKDQLAAELEPGDRKVARLASGIEVGSVTFTRGRASAGVINPRTLTEWVAANYPDEMEQQIRPTFLTAILEASKKAGVPMTPDGTVVPGIWVGFTEPYLAAKPTNVDALVDAIRAGQLLALEDGAE
jgi:hypothetical protein